MLRFRSSKKLSKIVYQSVIYFFNYHFSTVKFLFGKCFQNEKLSSALSIIPAVVFILLHTTLLAICGLYKFLIFVLLKLYYGKRFQRFVPGCGVITAFSKLDYGQVNVLIRLQSAQSGNELFEEIARQIEEKFFRSDRKRALFSLRKQKFGYHYFVTTDCVEMDDVYHQFSSEKSEITESEMMEIITKYFNSPLPKNNEFVWDFAFCTSSIIVSSEETNPNEKNYAFLMRVDHAFSDGIAIYNLLSNAFSQADDAKDQYIMKLTQPNEKTKALQQKCPTHVVNLHNACWKPKELIWTEKTLENGIYVGATRNCLGKIREIRKRFPGVSFLNVIYTAYSACLADYFLQFHATNDIPESIALGSPLQMNAERVKRLLAQDGRNDFDNDFSVFTIHCPILIGGDGNVKDTLIERMLSIQKQFDSVFNSFDIKGLYVCFKTFMAAFPVCLISKYLSKMFFGTLVSCVPGGPMVKFFNGAHVTNVCYYLPRRHAYGIGMGVLTYAEQLQVGFTLDGDKFSTDASRTVILDGFFKYIELLHEECSKVDCGAINGL